MTLDTIIAGARLSLRPARHMHIALKFLVMAVYVALLYTTHSLPSLALYSLLLLVGTVAMLLSVRLLYVPILAADLALLGMLSRDPTAQAVLVGLCKVCCLTQILAIFGATTPATELLRLFSARMVRLPGVQALIYLLSTTLAVLPSLQRDIRKSMDVAVLRGGRRLTWLLPKTWKILLLDVLIRTIYRSQRLADAVADRGFQLSTGLTVMPYQRLGVLDVLKTVLLLLPGLVVYRMSL